MKRRALRLPTALAMALTWSGCGGSDGRSSTTPTSLATPPPTSFGAGSVLTVVSGADLGPVAGATVIVAGREYTTNEAGQIVLAEAATFGSLVDVVAAEFLGRQTTLRANGGTRFVLWPRTATGGFNETFTAQIVYTVGTREPPEVGSTTLRRLRVGVPEVVVRISDEIRGDEGAYQAHQEAVEELSSWLGGRVRYALGDTLPPGGILFDARIDPAGEDCVDLVRAYFSGRRNGRGEIIGGEIVYCRIDVARTSTVAHELGHSVGLQHSYSGRDVMARYFTRSRNSGFSEREGLAMSLLFERPAGNRFPDSDRDVTGASSAPFKIRCP